MPNGNPFYVHPGYEFAPALAGLGEKLEVRRKEKEARIQEEERQKARSEVTGAIRLGDTDAIVKAMGEHPWMIDEIERTVKFKNEATKQNAIMSAARILKGEDPSKVLTERGEFVLDQGGDASNTIRLAEQAQTDPEAAMKEARVTLAVLAPDTLKALEKPEPKPYTDIGKIQADLKAGLITEEQAREAMTKRVDKEKYAPTNLKKLIDERKGFLDQGLTEDHPIIKAYDQKITGMDVELEKMTPDEIDMWGSWVNLTGKTPAVGRGKQATAMRVAILKSAARQALGADEAGVPKDPTRTPAEAALDVVATSGDTKAIQGSLNFLDKQLSSMGSFVANLESQVGKVEELSKDLETFNARLLNVPLRALRGRILGSPLQAKYDMYLTEIESEIGKLATGSTASVAELSVSAQDKWHKIHDKNLSVKDMLELLNETKNAARFRLDSVQSQLDKTRERMRTRPVPGQAVPRVAESLPEGATLIGTSGGKNVYQTPDGRQFIED